MAARALRLVDPDTGEITEQACPNCAGLQHTIDELTRKHHGLLAQLGKLRADKQAEANAHEWWGWGVALFQEWKVAAHHPLAQWTADRFWTCQPFLETYGFADCRYAVWGLAANCFERQVTPTYTKRYDEFWRVFGPSAGVQSADHFEGHVNEGKAIFGGDLPLTDTEAVLRVHRARKS